MIHFSEVLLREEALVTDRLLALLQVVGGPSLLYISQSWRVRGGLQDGQGCPEEHWDKTLMLTITGQEARDRGKRARANGPGNTKSSR